MSTFITFSPYLPSPRGIPHHNWLLTYNHHHILMYHSEMNVSSFITVSPSTGLQTKYVWCWLLLVACWLVQLQLVHGRKWRPGVYHRTDGRGSGVIYVHQYASQAVGRRKCHHHLRNSKIWPFSLFFLVSGFLNFPGDHITGGDWVWILSPKLFNLIVPRKEG